MGSVLKFKTFNHVYLLDHYLHEASFDSSSGGAKQRTSICSG